MTDGRTDERKGKNNMSPDPSRGGDIMTIILCYVASGSYNFLYMKIFCIYHFKNAL